MLAQDTYTRAIRNSLLAREVAGAVTPGSMSRSESRTAYRSTSYGSHGSAELLPMHRLLCTKYHFVPSQFLQEEYSLGECQNGDERHDLLELDNDNAIVVFRPL